MPQKPKHHLDPEKALRDLSEYVSGRGFRLSEPSEAIFRDAEVLGYEYDFLPMPPNYLYGLLRHMPSLQSILPGGVRSLRKVLQLVKEHVRDLDTDPYHADVSQPYSGTEDRMYITRKRLVDLTIAAARDNVRREIIPSDVLVALLDQYEESFPVTGNDGWSDPLLKAKENYLTHLVYQFHPELAVSFEVIRLAVRGDDTIPAFFDPIGSAPEDIRPHLKELFKDHPDYHHNCFLMMPFDQS